MADQQLLAILQGDCREVLKTLPDTSIHSCVTSPPYWGLRDYGHKNQIGLEKTPQEYVDTLRQVFSEVWRVLKDDGTLWLNLGDSYARSDKKGGSGFGGKNQKYLGDNYKRACANVPHGLKPKDLVGIPWRVAFALQADGWYLRSDIIWHKPNPMPESVTDRPTKAHEYLFLLTKSERYYYDQTEIKEPAKASSVARLGQDMESHEGSARAPGKTNGKMKAVKFGGNKQCPDTRLQSGKEWKPSGDYGHGAGRNDGDNHPSGGWCSSIMANKKSVWTVPTTGFDGAHFATFPPDLIKPCILAGCPVGGTVLDPFGGSGTTGMVAIELARKAILVELNPEYAELANQRCNVTPGLPLSCERALV